ISSNNSLSGIAINTEGAQPIILGISNSEVGRWDSSTPGKLLHGVAGSVVGQACFGNATSGTECVQPATGALGSGVATLPAGTYNIAGDSTTKTFTNTTFDTAGTGNVFKINGTAVSAVTGTGSTAVLSAGPTLTGTTTVAGLLSNSSSLGIGY